MRRTGGGAVRSSRRGQRAVELQPTFIWSRGEFCRLSGRLRVLVQRKEFYFTLLLLLLRTCCYRHQSAARPQTQHSNVTLKPREAAPGPDERPALGLLRLNISSFKLTTHSEVVVHHLLLMRGTHTVIVPVWALYGPLRPAGPCRHGDLRRGRASLASALLQMILPTLDTNAAPNQFVQKVF